MIGENEKKSKKKTFFYLFCAKMIKKCRKDEKTTVEKADSRPSKQNNRYGNVGKRRAL